jgi:hypothetical protein
MERCQEAGQCRTFFFYIGGRRLDDPGQEHLHATHANATGGHHGGLHVCQIGFDFFHDAEAVAF